MGESGEIFWKQTIQVKYQNTKVWHRRFCRGCMTTHNVKSVNETKVIDQKQLRVAEICMKFGWSL